MWSWYLLWFWRWGARPRSAPVNTTTVPIAIKSKCGTQEQSMRHRRLWLWYLEKRLLLFPTESKNRQGIGCGVLPLSYYYGKHETEAKVMNGFAKTHQAWSWWHVKLVVSCLAKAYDLQFVILGQLKLVFYHIQLKEFELNLGWGKKNKISNP